MTPDNTHLTHAKEKLRLKDYRTAEYLLISYLKENKSDTEALYLLGNLYHNEGKFDRAITAYKKVLSLKPTYTEAALSLSILYNDLGRYEEGRLIFNRVKHQVPSQEEVLDPYLDEKLAAKHVELGELYELYHRFKEAEIEYETALKLKPDDPSIIVKIARLHEKQGATDLSIRELKELLVQKPDYIPGLIKLGLAYYTNGKMIEALREWEKVLDIEPSHSEARMYLEMAESATTTSL